MKNAMLLMLVGALLGAVAASFIVPPMLSWYSAPAGLPQGATISSLVPIPEVIRYAISRLLWGQSIGAGLGAIAGLAISLTVGRRQKPAPAPPAR